MKETTFTTNTCSFPSELDISTYLIDNKTATYFVKVQGDSMQHVGIFSGDLLIVDRSKKASSKKIILACVNGEFTVRRLILKENKTFLYPENPNYNPLEITEGMDFEIFGVVTFNIHKPL